MTRSFTTLLGIAAALTAAAILPAATAARADVPQPAAAPSAAWNLPGAAPHLIFHYMPWFDMDPPVGGGSAWQHWSWSGPKASHAPSHRRPDGLRDIASVYYPLIGPYSTAERAVVRYHMQTIKAAGGEAVAVDWIQPGTFSDKRIPLILDEAQRAGLKVTLCYEEKSNFVWPDLRNPKSRAEAVDYVVSDLTYVLRHYAVHPAFLRRGGKPVLFQFNGYGQGALGPRYLTADEYVQVMKRLPEPIVFGRQGLEPEYTSSTAFRFLWWSSDADAIRRFAKGARTLIGTGETQFFMSFISPGFDDTGVWAWNADKPRVSRREGLSMLYGSFQNAFTGDPELIQVVTWNDFNEGTVMEPTRENGFWYLDALATWWAERKGRRAADLSALRQPFLHYTETCSPAEKAELPAPPYDRYLERKSLKVTDPHLLEHSQTPKGM